MEIVKSTGQRVEYDRNKIIRTLRRAGAEERLIDKILKRLEPKLKDGMTTRKVYSLLRKELKRASRAVAHRYNLRNALLRLGPAGFKFEKYVGSILSAYQYEVELPAEELLGLCVRHEIDVIAAKKGQRAMIEAKFRNKFGLTVSLKDTMATWSAYRDLVEGAKSGTCPKFDDLWIVTNGRFSERSYQFGICRGIRMIGWGSEEHSLARMVDHTTLYPITVFDDLKQWELDRLSDNNLMLCREIAGKEPARLAKLLKINRQRAKEIIEVSREVISS